MATHSYLSALCVLSSAQAVSLLTPGQVCCGTPPRSLRRKLGQSPAFERQAGSRFLVGPLAQLSLSRFVPGDSARVMGHLVSSLHWSPSIHCGMKPEAARDQEELPSNSFGSRLPTSHPDPQSPSPLVLTFPLPNKQGLAKLFARAE